MNDVNESWDENKSTRPKGMQQCVVSTRVNLDHINYLFIDSREATTTSEPEYILISVP